ncbi:formate dehydrogenase accessory sulfurtransferase FdhD [Marinomonas ostreistagni]|uniref:formate dehydrogenase accessory sulfurtransferase FdhD n=1 Tax=Marinomonas ostreistagni TaxID=359209 RepID=UPI001950CF5E|nr:formate dehydrogenase accessory sulfurtransferase FdhD [Marinomonas ostreistagni]MBM6551747.1 formate dehydrogenase accessory sulfurtransferase FdhD [Marinomonas ostreistagni]
MDYTGTRTQSYLSSGQSHAVELVEEVPIAISINELNYAVIMITPIDIEAFITGFAHSEGIIKQANEILDITLESAPAQGQQLPEHIRANIELTGRAQHRASGVMRQRKGTSGCGLCGIEAIEQSFPEMPSLTPSAALTDHQWLAAKAAFDEHQQVGAVSGAIHGAMLLSAEGDYLAFAEDIGRHNALDKLIGKAMMAGQNMAGCHILMSSRCSTELILKAVRAQVASLGHLASPSTLAVTQAKQYGLHLVHLPRRAEPRHFD